MVREWASSITLGMLLALHGAIARADEPNTHFLRNQNLLEDSTEAIRSMNQIVSSPLNRQVCEPHQDATQDFEAIWPSAYPLAIDYWRRTSCNDLMNNDPPAWWKRFAINTGLDGNNSWWPVCTMSLVNWQIGQHPTASSKEILGKYGQFVRELDSCAQYFPAPLPPVKQSSSTAPKLPPLLPPEILKNIPIQAEAIRKQAEAACCGADSFCKNQFSRVELDICNLNEGVLDPNCPPHGAAYRSYASFGLVPEAENLKDYNVFLAKVRPLYKLNKISVQVNARSGFVFDMTLTLRHEYGHVCDQISRLQNVVQGTGQGAAADVAAVREFNSRYGNRTEHCELGPDGLNAYFRRFQRTGANSETIKCLSETIKEHPKGLFGNKNCVEICPRQHLEEAFAEWFSFRLAKDNIEAQSSLLRACFGTRDDEHMLGADMLKCFMLSPQVRNQVRDATLCRY